MTQRIVIKNKNPSTAKIFFTIIAVGIAEALLLDSGLGLV
jgi:hypothetical protein